MSWKAAGLLLLICAGTASGANVYKWVDKDGNVQFSQEPPPTENVATEQLAIAEKGGIKPEKRAGRMYCGEERLPRMGDDPVSRIEELQNYIVETEHAKEEKQKQRLRLLKESFRYRNTDEISRVDTRLLEMDCQLAWARQEMETLAPEKERIAERVADVQSAITEVENKKIASCGIDNRTGMVVVDNDYRAYKRCIEPFDQQISNLRRTLKTAKRDRERVDGE